jgi:uncharacterized membrane protein YbhN (UPF0104 family)
MHLGWALALGVLAAAGEWLIRPELRQAHFSLLTHLAAAWLAAGVLLQAGSQLCFSLLTRCLLPAGGPGLGTVARIDLSCTALAHTVPAGSAASAALGYRMFTGRGVPRSDMCFVLATQGPGSSVVLNVLLWASLVIAIPLTGFHRVSLAAGLAGAAGLLIAAGLVYAVTRREERTVRLARSAGALIPRLGAGAAERPVRAFAASVRSFTRDPRRMRAALRWAAANWLLQAAALWCFVASLGRYADPVVLFAAFGIANVAAALPLSPSGLGVVEGTLPLLLAGGGVPTGVAVLALIGWRLVSFWLPIPAGAVAYASLHLGAARTARARGRAVRAPAAPAPARGPPAPGDPLRARGSAQPGGGGAALVRGTPAYPQAPA